MRQNLAFNLKAVVAQKLLPTTKELGRPQGITRVPTNEIMRSNPTVRKLILNEEDIKLGDAIRIGKEEGMQDFTESLKQLVQSREDRARDGLRGRPERRAAQDVPQGDFGRPAWYSVSSRGVSPGTQ